MPFSFFDSFGVGIVHNQVDTKEEHKNIELTAIVRARGKHEIVVKSNAFVRKFPYWKGWVMIKVISYIVKEEGSPPALYVETYGSTVPFTKDGRINNNINDLVLQTANTIRTENPIKYVTLHGNMDIAYMTCYEIEPPLQPSNEPFQMNMFPHPELPKEAWEGHTRIA